MRNINCLMLCGRLTKNPELKATSGGTPVLEFSLAYNTSRKSQNGWEDEANYIDCTVYGNQAEALSQILRKGMKVSAVGSLRHQKWQSQDGMNRSKHVYQIDQLELPDRQRDQEVADESIPF